MVSLTGGMSGQNRIQVETNTETYAFFPVLLVEFREAFRSVAGWIGCRNGEFRQSDDRHNSERLGSMAFVRSLSTLVLMACVSLVIGCGGGESTSNDGPVDVPVTGSGVLGGAPAVEEAAGEEAAGEEAAGEEAAGGEAAGEEAAE